MPVEPSDDGYEDEFETWMNPTREGHLFQRDAEAEDRAAKAEAKVKNKQDREKLIAQSRKDAEKLWDAVQAHIHRKDI